MCMILVVYHDLKKMINLPAVCSFFLHFCTVCIVTANEEGSVSASATDQILPYNYLDRYDKLVKLALSDLKTVSTFIQVRQQLVEAGRGDKFPREIKEYVEDFYAANGDVTQLTKETAKNIVDNPISTYRLLLRYIHKLPQIFKLKLDPAFGEWKKNTIKGRMRWPNEKDLAVAHEGIFKLQQIYDIPAREFSRGNLSGVMVTGRLDFDQMIELGEAASMLSYSAYALEWWELAKEKGEEEGAEFEDMDRVNNFIQLTQEAHDAEFDKDDPLNPWIFDQPFQMHGSSPGKFKERTRRRDSLFKKFRGSRHEDHVDINLWGLCNGENCQTAEEKQKLFCWHEFEIHPKFTIGPLRMEFFHRNPEVLMIHEFIGEDSIAKIHRIKKKEWRPMREKAVDQRTGEWVKVDGAGLGSIFWVWDGLDNPDGLTLAQNLEDATGFQLVTPGDSEDLYVKSYTWATKSEPHVDSAYIANALHYLSDVDHGGRTAFPSLGLSVKPIKGALLLWFSQMPRGGNCEESLHVSCPVIYGRKLIATKWPWPLAQFPTFKCRGRPEDNFEIAVNGKRSNFVRHFKSG